MQPLPTPTREQAAHWMRDVGVLASLEALNTSPVGIPGPVRLRSLLEVAEFLMPFTDTNSGTSREGVNFIDTGKLAAWARETVGDAALADAIDRIVAQNISYLVMAPLIQQTVIGRVAQYWELLKAGEGE